MQPPPPSLADAFSRELLGEQVLWAASPSRWAYARRHWTTALIGIPWTAMAAVTFLQSNHARAGETLAYQAFSFSWDLLFVGIGVVMLASPLWAAWRAGSVYYVVTDKRAVIFEKLFKVNIRSFSPLVVSGFERVSRGGPEGDIIFMRVPHRTSKGRTKITEIGFLGLADYARAEQAIATLAASANTR